MGQWTKFFFDGTKYIGSDKSIALRKASWTKSRNDGIVSVLLEHNNKSIQIFGTGNYWQADRYVYSFSQQSSILTARCVQFQSLTDINICIFLDENRCIAREFKNFCTTLIPRYQLFQLKTGQWLTLEYDITNDQLKFYIKDSKI